jgi:effector-binding domain-containing protein
MKILKKIIIILLILVAIVLVIAAFMPSKRHIEASLTINAPANAIYKQVIDLRYWNTWSPFQEGDTAMKTSYSGELKGVGAIMSWQSKKQGNGVMTIMEAIKDKSIHTKIDFEGQGSSFSDWKLVEDNYKTTVTWSMEMDNLKYPVGRIMGLLMKSMITKSFNKGLANLKKVSEEYFKALSFSKTSEIKIKQTEMQYALVIKDSSKCDDVDVLFEKIYGEIGQYVGENKIEVTGHPFGRYFVWDAKADRNVMEAGFFIKNKVAGKNNIRCIELPSEKVVSAIHYGPYETTYDTHIAIDQYLKENKLTTNGIPLEIYIKDPGSQPDMTKWETEVIYPIK